MPYPHEGEHCRNHSPFANRGCDVFKAEKPIVFPVRWYPSINVTFLQPIIRLSLEFWICVLGICSVRQNAKTASLSTFSIGGCTVIIKIDHLCFIQRDPNCICVLLYPICSMTPSPLGLKLGRSPK